MKVSDLGEFGLIELLSRMVNETGSVAERDGLILGIGDDAAVWHGKPAMQMATSDILIQDVHFSLNTATWYELGWKSLAVNISDIAAMGGIPEKALVSLGIPPETEVASIVQLYEGMIEIANQFDIIITGGDISSSSAVIVSPCLLGHAPKNKIMTRSGAKSGELIAVTGHLGASAAGFKLLNQNSVIESDLRIAHLKPNPRIKEAQVLNRLGIQSAIDISDGLLADLSHICKASNVGAQLNLSDIPIHPSVTRSFSAESLTLALNGGEDYELLFTGPEEIISSIQKELSTPVTVIGRIIDDEPGKTQIVDENGTSLDGLLNGWDHFAK